MLDLQHTVISVDRNEKVLQKLQNQDSSCRIYFPKTAIFASQLSINSKVYFSSWYLWNQFWIYVVWIQLGRDQTHNRVKWRIFHWPMHPRGTKGLNKYVIKYWHPVDSLVLWNDLKFLLMVYLRCLGEWSFHIMLKDHTILWAEDEDQAYTQASNWQKHE